MTSKQTKYYWRAWAAAHRADPAADRHALTLRALGKTVSSKDLTNSQFDRVLAAFAAVAQPNSVDAQMRQAGMFRTRALHTIRKAPASYVQKLCADRFGVRDYATLSDADLATLAMTLNNRKNAKAPPAAPSDPEGMAGTPLHAASCPCEGSDSAVSDADIRDAEAALQSAAEIPKENCPF